MFGCDFASSGGLLSKISASSGCSVSVGVGSSSLLSGICSRSGPNIVANVGLAGGFGSFCLLSKVFLSYWVANRGVRKSIG